MLHTLNRVENWLWTMTMATTNLACEVVRSWKLLLKHSGKSFPKRKDPVPERFLALRQRIHNIQTILPQSLRGRKAIQT
jgi:hypothetical protein